jgi:hypothetical protein
MEEGQSVATSPSHLAVRVRAQMRCADVTMAVRARQWGFAPAMPSDAFVGLPAVHGESPSPPRLSICTAGAMRRGRLQRYAAVAPDRSVCADGFSRGAPSVPEQSLNGQYSQAALQQVTRGMRQAALPTLESSYNSQPAHNGGKALVAQRQPQGKLVPNQIRGLAWTL